MKTTTNSTGLLWSEDGRVGCAKPGHAPYKGSDTWRRERWRAMKRAGHDSFARDLGRVPRCESCAADARNAVVEPLLACMRTHFGERGERAANLFRWYVHSDVDPLGEAVRNLAFEKTLADRQKRFSAALECLRALDLVLGGVQKLGGDEFVRRLLPAIARGNSEADAAELDRHPDVPEWAQSENRTDA
jgi:hypothetical protein